jgi:hypothetical protein
MSFPTAQHPQVGASKRPEKHRHVFVDDVTFSILELKSQTCHHSSVPRPSESPGVTGWEPTNANLPNDGARNCRVFACKANIWIFRTGNPGTGSSQR